MPSKFYPDGTVVPGTTWHPPRPPTPAERRKRKFAKIEFDRWMASQSGEPGKEPFQRGDINAGRRP